MQDPRPLVRIATAGSVDDGKSTLIGRLLYETGSLKEDQLTAVQEASRRSGETEINFALLTDGLIDEREQKITIDVAYRPFSTPRCRFLLADTPGHAQYTRNMFTGASLADGVLILVDAGKGATVQTKRHLFLASLLRVPHVAVVVNKMDLVRWSEEAFLEVCGDLRRFTEKLAFGDLRFLPLSGLTGANLTQPSPELAWHRGGTVLEALESFAPASRKESHELRFVIQGAVRPDSGFRGVSGRAVSGSVRRGDELVLLPEDARVRVKSLHGLDGPQDEGVTGEPVVLELEPEVDASRGAVLVRPLSRPDSAWSIEAMVCWMSGSPGHAPRRVRALQGANDVPAVLERVEYVLDLAALGRTRADQVETNDVCRVALSLGEPLAVDRHDHVRATGRLLLVDPETNECLAAGVVVAARDTRLMGLAPRVVWLTGLSGAGKTTLAEGLAERLRRRGEACVVLDGDVLRGGLSADLGYSDDDRDENVRRTAELARLLCAQGVTVVCSLISPREGHRARARQIVGDPFVLVHVDAPLEVLEERDPKGLYRKARSGALPEFTGVSAPFERPDHPDLSINTAQTQIEEGVDALWNLITMGSDVKAKS
jgi:bifunctional enzyme CysN/CysC